MTGPVGHIPQQDIEKAALGAEVEGKCAATQVDNLRGDCTELGFNERVIGTYWDLGLKSLINELGRLVKTSNRLIRLGEHSMQAQPMVGWWSNHRLGASVGEESW